MSEGVKGFQRGFNGGIWQSGPYISSFNLELTIPDRI